MSTQVEIGKASKFKSIFRSQIDTAINNNYPRKPINKLEISPPILQHSTSIFSLVSPCIRHKNKTELYQAQIPAPTPPRLTLKKTYNSVSTVIPSSSSKKYEHLRHHKTTLDCPISIYDRTHLRRHSSYLSSDLYPIEEEPKKTMLRKLTERHYKVDTIASNKKKQVGDRDKEKMRKMQELEDFITGRRTSTIRFTLTPKGLN